MPHSRDADKSEPPTTARVELGKLLNRWRYDAPGKPSQASVASRVALTQPMVSKYEAGVHVPSREVVRLLVEHYGRPATDLEHALGICARAEQENRGGEKAEQPAPEPPTGTSHPTARRQRLLWLGGVLVLVAVGGGAYAVWGRSDPAGHKNQAAPPANSSAASSAKETASCSGITCLHTDPSNTVCQYDAVTTADGRDFGVFVELRYSPSCRAGWARMDGGSPGDRIQVFGTEGSPPELEEYRQQSGHTTHTKMVQAPVPAGDRALCSRPIQRHRLLDAPPGHLLSPAQDNRPGSLKQHALRSNRTSALAVNGQPVRLGRRTPSPSGHGRHTVAADRRCTRSNRTATVPCPPPQRPVEQDRRPAAPGRLRGPASRRGPEPTLFRQGQNLSVQAAAEQVDGLGGGEQRLVAASGPGRHQAQVVQGHRQRQARLQVAGGGEHGRVRHTVAGLLFAPGGEFEQFQRVDAELRVRVGRGERREGE